jgi:hypothetical protein
VSLQARAQASVSVAAQRLADPGQVAARFAGSRTGDGEASRFPGAAGVALLYAELACHDAAYRPALRAWLSAAAQAADLASGQGLYAPIPGLAFALDQAATHWDDYQAARDHLQAQARVLVERTLEREEQRVLGSECPAMQTYDVISGLAGGGMLLLGRRETAGLETAGSAADKDLLRRALAAVVRLAQPQVVDGVEFPGWWVAQEPFGHQPVPPRNGHSNLGLAHGIAGPLALLALARIDGIHVDGQAAAAARFAGTLVDLAQVDDFGPWWHRFIQVKPVSGENARPGRPSWCYGSPGIARALQLAGRAFGVAAWQRIAETALLAAISRVTAVDAQAPLTEAGLCHGWAGLLQAASRIAADQPGGQISAQLPLIAERALELADSGEAFGFIPPPVATGLPDQSAGFLSGAAGTALALHAVATGRPPATSWDRMLLLA